MVACAAYAIWSEGCRLVLPRLAFFVFEMCVGLYFPMMGTMKGQIVPEFGPQDAKSASCFLQSFLGRGLKERPSTISIACL